VCFSALNATENCINNIAGCTDAEAGSWPIKKNTYGYICNEGSAGKLLFMGFCHQIIGYGGFFHQNL